MNAVPIVLLYAGLNGLLALVLVGLVVRQRYATRTNLGVAGQPALERAVRAHGNFVEYVPLILLLMLLLALGGAAPTALHLLGIALTLGRLLHAWGLSRSSGRSFGRASGIVLTWASLLGASAMALRIALHAL